MGFVKTGRLAAVALAAFVGMDVMAEVKDGATFWIGTVPEELVAERRMGESVRFSLEENASTGFSWPWSPTRTSARLCSSVMVGTRGRYAARPVCSTSP